MEGREEGLKGEGIHQRSDASASPLTRKQEGEKQACSNASGKRARAASIPNRNSTQASRPL